MDKYERIIILLPYKLRKNLDVLEIERFFRIRKQIMKYVLLFVILFAIITFVLIVFSKIEKISSYFLAITALINVVIYFINYRQFNISKEDIGKAIKLYKEKIEVKSTK